jgi:hypothetical protein
MYCTYDMMILMWEIFITRAIGRMDPEIETCLVSEIAMNKVSAIFAKKKASISGPTPSNGLSSGFDFIKQAQYKKQVHW